MCVKRLSILLLACCFWLLPVGTCSAEYRMTEAELTKLETIFQQLELSNSQLLIDLTAARQRLEEYQKDLAALQGQLGNTTERISSSEERVRDSQRFV